MNKRFYPLIAMLILILVSMACAAFNGSPSSSQDEVATVVALTLQAMTPSGNAATATAAPETGATLLPRSLYYLNNGSNAKLQIFRMEKDGKTVQQLTSEPAGVGPYDVSQVDGRVAYVANNQLIVINSDGSTRTVLVDGGVIDPNDPIVNTLGSPVWSPDGRTIAYAHHGLNFYSLDTGSSTLVLENKFQDVSGLKIANEIYSPQAYSPDGKKLLINIGFYEGGTMAIYYPDARTLVRLSGSDSGQPCCDAVWTADSAGLYAASPYMGMISSGLWHINASDGEVTTLIPTQSPDGTYNFADAPIIGPDGQLYFFFANLKDIPNGHTPLQIVRSGLDGVTERTVLSPKTFETMNEALWAADAGFVIEISASDATQYQGGVATIVFVEGRNEVQLVPNATQMKWGP
jgi:Tol biopolymer transport system component